MAGVSPRRRLAPGPGQDVDRAGASGHGLDVGAHRVHLRSQRARDVPDGGVRRRAGVHRVQQNHRDAGREYTLNNNGPDYIDISLVDGFNVPMS